MIADLIIDWHTLISLQPSAV